MEGLAVGLCAAPVGVTVGVVFTVGVTVGVVFTVGVTVGVVVGACVGDGDGEATGAVGVGDVGTGVLLTGEPCTPGVVVGVGVWVAPGVEVLAGVDVESAVVPFVLAASTMLVTASRPVATSRAIMIWLPEVHPFPLPSQSVVSKVPWSSVSVEPGLSP